MYCMTIINRSPITGVQEYRTGAKGGGVVAGEQSVGGFVVFCGEFDQNLLGRGFAWKLRRIHRVVFVSFVNGGPEPCPEEAIHFRDDFKWVTPSGGPGWVRCRIRPQDFGW